MEYGHRRLAYLNFIKTLSPAWYEEKERKRARYIEGFDLDLAANRSMSLAAKVAIQRERNYRRLNSHDRQEVRFDIEDAMVRMAMGDEGD